MTNEPHFSELLKNVTKKKTVCLIIIYDVQYSLYGHIFVQMFERNLMKRSREPRLAESLVHELELELTETQLMMK